MIFGRPSFSSRFRSRIFTAPLLGSFAAYAAEQERPHNVSSSLHKVFYELRVSTMSTVWVLSTVSGFWYSNVATTYTITFDRPIALHDINSNRALFEQKKFDTGCSDNFFNLHATQTRLLDCTAEISLNTISRNILHWFPQQTEHVVAHRNSNVYEMSMKVISLRCHVVCTQVLWVLCWS